MKVPNTLLMYPDIILTYPSEIDSIPYEQVQIACQEKDSSGSSEEQPGDAGPFWYSKTKSKTKNHNQLVHAGAIIQHGSIEESENLPPSKLT